MKRLMFSTAFFLICPLLWASVAFGWSGVMPQCLPGESWFEVLDKAVCVSLEKSRDMPQCGPEQRLCQVGSNEWVCVKYDKPCPPPNPVPPIPECGPGKRLCQVSFDDYICVDCDKPCPNPW